MVEVDGGGGDGEGKVVFWWVGVGEIGVDGWRNVCMWMKDLCLGEGIGNHGKEFWREWR